MKHEKNPQWIKSLEEEIMSIEKNDTWKLVSRTKNTVVISLKWFSMVKRDVDDSISK